MKRAGSARLVCALLIGFLFLVPHLVRMIEIHSARDYTPFSATSPSAITWDETFLYGAEVNYMVQHHALANDTDTFEHRSEPFPYSVLPVALQAAIAEAIGGVERAQILCSFLFPALTAWILIGLFLRCGTDVPLAATLALLVMAVGFSSATVLHDDMALLRHGLHGTAFNTIAASRNPNPNMTFALYLGAIVCLCAGLRRKSMVLMTAAGVLGGLLFYSYVYYAIGWCFALVLLVVISLLRPQLSKKVIAAFAATIAMAVPFVWWSHISRTSGAYLNRAKRLGMVYGHLPSGKVLLLSLMWIAVAATAWIIWRKLRVRLDGSADRNEFAILVLVLMSCILGGIAGMNMQVATGFNVQADLHFQHMILHPVSILLFCVLAALALRNVRFGWTTCAVLFALCLAAQVESGAATAPFHRMLMEDRALFTWLNRSTEGHAVVSTTDLRLCTLLPLYTHDATLLANGSRSSGTNEELIERYLLASKLSRTPAEVVRAQLSQELGPGAPLPFVTYSYFLFETSPYIVPKRRNFEPSALPLAIKQYDEMNVAAELEHLRVDYVWMNDGAPILVPGWSASQEFKNGSGTLWRLHKLSAKAG